MKKVRLYPRGLKPLIVKTAPQLTNEEKDEVNKLIENYTDKQLLNAIERERKAPRQSVMRMLINQCEKRKLEF